MAVATLVGILEDDDKGQIAFELDNESVVWGDARTLRSEIAQTGLRVGDVIDYTLKDTGELGFFRVVTQDR